MICLVDTNVLVQLASRKAPKHILVRAVLKRLRYDGSVLQVSAQNLMEFWNVATRPTDKNGIGMDYATATRVLRMLERFFVPLPETPQVYAEWRRLVLEHQVMGVQVHDAYLVALMRVNGVSHILSFNGKDFVRYEREGIVVIDPNSDAMIRMVRESVAEYQAASELSFTSRD